MTRMQEQAATAERGVDGVVERLGRWTAARSTRRSFIGRLGRVGVLVAGGTGMASLLADSAEARVCGQSGVAPKCSTFDCNATWGWCWYASGCCADGALKKICDCCAPNTPHPVGYCPSGTRVLCIVESCGADPRLQTKQTVELGTADPVRLSVLLARTRYANGAPIAVVGDAEHAGFASIAASTGVLSGGPVLLSARARLSQPVAEELRRLGVQFVTLVGSHVSATAEAEIRALGIDVQRVGTSGDLSELAAQVARWSRPLTGARRAMVVLPSAERSLPSAAATAGALRMPLLVGDTAATRAALDDPRGTRTTYVVSTSAGDAERFPGGRAVAGADGYAQARALADLLIGLRGGSADAATLAAHGDDRAAAAMASMPGTLLRHEPGSLDGARGWFLARRLQVTIAFVAGDRSTFSTQARYDLQALLNEYETHLLRGQAGEGLPVIPQPREERPIGRARRT
jgi:hypothetical protein